MADDTPTLEQLLGLDTEGGSGGESKPDGKGLRAQLEAVLAERKQLQEQLAQAGQRERTRAAAELVTKHNIPPVAQKLLLQQVQGDLTDESVTKFVEEFGELWGAKAAEASTTPDQQSATQQVQALTAQSHDVSMTSLFDEDAQRTRFAEAKTREDVMRLTAEAMQGVQLLE